VAACSAGPFTSPSGGSAVEITAGSASTPAELAGWDATYDHSQHEYWRGLCNMMAWITPSLAKDPSCSPVIDRAPLAAYHDEWDVHDWAIALATMYELSGDATYLDMLGQLDDVLVASAGAFDAVRGRHYAGWVIDRGCQWGSLDVTGLLGDMLARYARVVSEHGVDLGPDYLARAARYADAAAAALSDTPDDERRGDATHLLYLTTPHASPTCTAQITTPGMPYPYNMDHLMMGAMTDVVVARANGIDSDAIDTMLAVAASDLPRLWTQWREDAVMTSGADIILERWPSNSSPIGTPLIEDSSHAAVTIELTTRIEKQADALTAMVPAAWDPTGWDAAVGLDAGFASTLVDLATADPDGTWIFPGDMNGAANAEVYSRAQESCAGWALLAPHSSFGFARCLDVTLADVDDTQPNLTAGNLAALLWMKPAMTAN
jgi:hypothetical protein